MEPARFARTLVLCSLPMIGSAIGCASDSPKQPAAISLALTVPKSLIDVDKVTLYVYEQGDVPCVKNSIGVPPTSTPRVFELGLGICTLPSKARAWCASGSLPLDPERLLTFYIEGRFNGAKQGGFTGCAEAPVAQDPTVIDIKAQPLVEGVKCGDKSIGLGETCDPGAGAGDEACDAAKCQTNEVILSNGKASSRFYRGVAAHKTGLDLHFSTDGHFFGAWSDRATGFDGADGSEEITIRRLSDSLITESSPLVLSQEVRMPDGSAGANTDGSKRRGGSNTFPSFVPIGATDWLAVWLREGKVVGSVQHTGLGTAAGADFDVATTGDAPSAASSTGGDAMIVYADGGNAKSVLRKSDGTLGAAVTLGAIGTPAVNRPRVAWVGGDWVVVWGDGQDIKLQRLAADGSAKGAVIVANEGSKAGVQDSPDVGAFPTGEFLVAWRDAAGEVGSDIRVQRFDVGGAATGTEIAAVLNDQSKAGEQDSPVVTTGSNATGAGTKFFLVAWRNANDKQIGARFIGAGGGFLISNLGATSSEFAVGVGGRVRSSPAVACLNAKGYCGIGWFDDEGGDVAADDDRVRVRRVPMPN